MIRSGVRRGATHVLVAAALAAAAIGAVATDQVGAVAEEREINSRYLLVDGRGRSVSNEDFPGRFQLVSFGYTYCPDICPTTLVSMAQILRALGPKAERLQAIFVSVDPERDSAAALDRYTRHFDPRILGLTGSPELVRSAADHFKVRYEKYSEPGAEPGNYSIDHSAGLYLLGPDGAFAAKFAHGAPPTETAGRIAAFMATSRKTPGRR